MVLEKVLHLLCLLVFHQSREGQHIFKVLFTAHTRIVQHICLDV